MKSMLMTVTAVATLVACSTPAIAQDRRGSRDSRDEHSQKNAFEWSGELARGQRLTVYNINGSVSVEPARGNKVEIVADKFWSRGRAEDATVEVHRVRGDRDVVVCAIWRNQNTECDENGYHSHSRGDHDGNIDTRVDFTIRLPAGAHITANTVNGDIEIAGASGDIAAMTVNGGIDAESSEGTVEARTVSGDIHVRLARVPTRGVSYETVSGSVTVSLPSGLDADVEASTVSGAITSDFPITVGGGSRRDGFSSRKLSGTIGRGGPRIDLKTVSGAIHLEKSGNSRAR